MFAESTDDEQIIERVAALDIGKAELVCCVRVPASGGAKRRVTAVGSNLNLKKPSPAPRERVARSAG